MDIAVRLLIRRIRPAAAPDVLRHAAEREIRLAVYGYTALVAVFRLAEIPPVLGIRLDLHLPGQRAVDHRVHIEVVVDQMAVLVFIRLIRRAVRFTVVEARYQPHIHDLFAVDDLGGFHDRRVVAVASPALIHDIPFPAALQRFRVAAVVADRLEIIAVGGKLDTEHITGAVGEIHVVDLERRRVLIHLQPEGDVLTGGQLAVALLIRCIRPAAAPRIHHRALKRQLSLVIDRNPALLGRAHQHDLAVLAEIIFDIRLKKLRIRHDLHLPHCVGVVACRVRRQPGIGTDGQARRHQAHGQQRCQHLFHRGNLLIK